MIGRKISEMYLQLCTDLQGYNRAWLATKRKRKGGVGKETIPTERSVDPAE